MATIEVGQGEAATPSGGCRALGGKIGGTLFFAIFLGMGLLFVALTVGESLRQMAVWLWPEVECTILSSGVDATGDDESPYRPSVLFEYQIDGHSYRSDAVSRGDEATSSYDSARGPSDRHPAGSRATARVDPDVPGDAVLERRLPWTLLVVPLPLIFVAIGAGGIFMIWKGLPGRLKASGEGESISQRARGLRSLGHRIELGIGLVFAVVGGVLSVLLLVVPGARLLAAAGWVEVPATVLDATLRSWSTDDGTSYRADVLYEYSAGGRSWRSNRRSFFPMSSSGYDGSQAVVERYPAGSSTSCFVDPDQPSRSVLDRSFRPEYLIGLFGLLFLLPGLAVTAHALKARRLTVAEPSRIAEPSRADDDSRGDEPVERHLEPAAGPVAKVLGMLFIACFWNGIVSVFVWQAVAAFRHGSPDWFLTVFLIPFVAVGLALVGGVVYAFLAAFNPRPRLTISPGAPRLGDRLRVEWSFAGRPGRIRHLAIVLEGHERASYRRGTDTHTDRAAFAAIDLVDSTADWEIPRGSAEVSIPEDTMHSFASANNAVVWSLVVHGEIARWPDVSETFEVEVRPLAPERLLP